MRLGAVVLALTLGASACIPGGTTGVPEREADPDASPGGRLVVGITPPDGIDPTNAHEPSGIAVARTMCDTLVDVDPQTGDPLPALAEAWTPGRRGSTVTFTLRRGMRFHNGREVRAEDVAYTLNRLASAEFASRAAHVLEPVAGYAEFRGEVATDVERFTTQLAGVRAIGPYGLEITLSGELSEFFRALAHPATAPVPREEVERDPEGFARAPVCAGPYAVAEPWDGEGPLRLRRVEDHQGTNAAYTRGGAGYADEIELAIHADADAVFDAFLAGDVDLAVVPPGSETDELPGARLVQESTPLLELVGFPVDTPPFDRAEVRTALSLAVDREGLAERFGGEAARGFLPGQPCDAAPARPDVEAARRLPADLDEPIRLHFNDEFRNAEIVAAVAAGWEEAFGIEVELVAQGWEEYLERITRAPGFDGPFRFGWMPPYPSRDRVLHALLHADSVGRNNASRWASRDFSDVIRSARRTVAADEREDAYAFAALLACRELPMTPLFLHGKTLAVRDTVASAVGRFTGAGFAEPLLRELYLR